ncbi:NAD-dependent epimerase/dehydratase family protein [Alphaproteobacteria bacterium]|nr:NAD-dependent epimerase/dehydratase family protein [Alphaproteobacteria bacterium]
MDAIQARVLVTGGSGFIGSRLVAHLKRKRVRVTSIDSSKLDLRNEKCVEDFLKTVHFDAIFHCASLGPNPGKLDKEDYISQELLMTQNLLRFSSSNTKFLFLGSMSEYGASGILNEQMICAPNTPYGVAKLKCTDSVILNGKQSGRNIVVARIFGAYGPGEQASRLIPEIVKSVRCGNDLLLTDGEQTRDFVHVDYICSSLGRIFFDNLFEGQVVNIGSGKGLKIKDVVSELVQEGYLNPNIVKFNAIDRRVTDQEILVADVSKLTSKIPKDRNNVLRFIYEQSSRN